MQLHYSRTSCHLLGLLLFATGWVGMVGLCLGWCVADSGGFKSLEHLVGRHGMFVLGLHWVLDG